MPRQFNGGRIVFTNRSERIGYLHAEGWIWTLTSHHTQKSNLKYIINLNIRVKTIKLLEKKIEQIWVILDYMIIFWIHQTHEEKKRWTTS